MKSFPFLLAALAGIATAAQAVINTQLRGRLADPMQAATVSFTVGTLVCWIYCLISRAPLPAVEAIRATPWWMWTGGLLGAFYVWTSIVVTRQLGVAAMLGILVASQMVSSLAIDHWGAFHTTIRPATLPRIAGAVMVVLGVCLMVLSPGKK